MYTYKDVIPTIMTDCETNNSFLRPDIRFGRSFVDTKCHGSVAQRLLALIFVFTLVFMGPASAGATISDDVPPVECEDIRRSLKFGIDSRILKAYCGYGCMFDEELSKGCDMLSGAPAISLTVSRAKTFLEEIIIDPAAALEFDLYSEVTLDTYVDSASLIVANILALLPLVAVQFRLPSVAKVLAYIVVMFSAFFLVDTTETQAYMLITGLVAYVLPSSHEVVSVAGSNLLVMVIASIASMAVRHDVAALIIALVLFAVILYNMFHGVVKQSRLGGVMFTMSCLHMFGMLNMIHKMIRLRLRGSPIIMWLDFFIRCVFPHGMYVTSFQNSIFSWSRMAVFFKTTYPEPVNVLLVCGVLNIIVFFAMRIIYSRALRYSMRIRAREFSLLDDLLIYCTDISGGWFLIRDLMVRPRRVQANRVVYACVSVGFVIHECFYAHDILLLRIILAMSAWCLGWSHGAFVRYLSAIDCTDLSFPQLGALPSIDVGLIERIASQVYDLTVSFGERSHVGRCLHIGKGKLLTVKHVIENARSACVNNSPVMYDVRNFSGYDDGLTDPVCTFTLSGFNPTEDLDLPVYVPGTALPAALLAVSPDGIFTPITRYTIPRNGGTAVIHANLTFGDSGSPIFAVSDSGKLSLFGAVSGGNPNRMQGNTCSMVQPNMQTPESSPDRRSDDEMMYSFPGEENARVIDSSHHPCSGGTDGVPLRDQVPARAPHATTFSVKANTPAVEAHVPGTDTHSLGRALLPPGRPPEKAAPTPRDVSCPFPPGRPPEKAAPTACDVGMHVPTFASAPAGTDSLPVDPFDTGSEATERLRVQTVIADSMPVIRKQLAVPDFDQVNDISGGHNSGGEGGDVQGNRSKRRRKSVRKDRRAAKAGFLIYEMDKENRLCLTVDAINLLCSSVLDFDKVISYNARRNGKLWEIDKVTSS